MASPRTARALALPLLAAALAAFSGAACSDDTPDNVARAAAAYEARCTPPAERGRRTEQAVTPDGVVVNQAEAGACADAREAGFCRSAHCRSMFREAGTLAEGAFCRWDEQCASGRCSSSNGCGVCERNTKCTATSCPAPQVCTADGCEAPRTIVGEGAACDGRAACADGLACLDGICGKLAAAGEACDKAPCAAGFACTTGARPVCVAAGEGAACDKNPCDPQFACVNKVCRAARAAATGEACDGATLCGGGGSCVEGVCVAAKKLDEPCTSAFRCAGGVCDTSIGKCVSLDAYFCK